MRFAFLAAVALYAAVVAWGIAAVEAAEPGVLDRLSEPRTHAILRHAIAPGTGESDQSLSALLARRDRVRSSRPTPVVAPSDKLFAPKQTPVVSADDELRKSTGLPSEDKTTEETAAKPPEETTTTSRLLEAKRRARKR
jgi:hypothetical protein